MGLRRFLPTFRSWRKRGRSKKLPKTSKGIRTSILFFLLGGVCIVLFSQWKSFFTHHSTALPSSGGIFTESSLGQIKNLSPFALNNSATDKDLQSLLFEGLLKYDTDSGQIINGIGNLRISEDKKTYYITLKPDIYFHDNKPVTLDDVLFTYETVIQNQNFPHKHLQEAFEYVNIKRVDEYTLSFTLPEQNVFFPFLLVQPILPQKAFQNALIEEIVDPDHPFNKNPVGTGPYKLNNILKNEDGSSRVFLTSHSKYHDGEPNIPQVVLYLYPSIESLQKNNSWTTTYAHIPKRELDYFVDKSLNSFEDSDLSPINKYKQQSYVLPRFTGLFFNLDKPVVENLPLRQALRFALPKDRIMKREEGWFRVDSPFFFDSIENWHDLSYSRARQILRDSGYRYDDDLGVRLTGDNPVNLTLLTSTSPSVYSRIAQKTKEVWEEELDIKIDLQVLPPDEFLTAVKNRDYDIVLYGLNNGENYEGLSIWHSSQSEQLNLANLTNQKIDFLISEIRFSGSTNDLILLNNRIDQLVPTIVLGTPEYYVLTDKRLKGYPEEVRKIRSHGQRFDGIDTWYFEEKLSWDWPKDKSKIWGYIKWLFGNKNPLNRGDVKARLEP